MKIAVITANIGGIDAPKSFPEQSIECDYYAYNDSNLPFPMVSLENRMKAKYFKLQIHKILPQYDVFVWVDGNVQIHSSDFVRNITDALINDIAISKHPERDCIYKEAQFVVDRIGKGDNYLKVRYQNHPMLEEVDYYQSLGYPENAGLCWCGLFARKNNDKVNDFFDDWWQSNIEWSNFDQNSFMFNIKKHSIKLNLIDWGSYYDNNNHSVTHHKKTI